MAKTIALDIGNVCLEINLKNCVESLGVKWDSWLPPDLLNATDAMERGKLSEEKWLAIFADSTDGKFSNGKLKEAYNAIIGAEIRETRAFVEMAAKAGYRIVFFSDTSRIHLDHVFANLSFAHLITGGVYSFEEKIQTKKPESAMFAAFEERFGPPSLYLDDKQENIQAGFHTGWPSLQFESGTMSAEELYAAIK